MSDADNQPDCTTAPLPWRIEPLGGKYYGTVIVDANGERVCELWNHNNCHEPSQRERARHGGDGDFSDTHHENVRDFEAAELIVRAVNGLAKAQKSQG